MAGPFLNANRTDVTPYKHINIILDWASSRQLKNTAVSIIDIVVDQEVEQLLGGILRFLSFKDTNGILQEWAASRPSLRKLAILSDHLLTDFPAVKVAPTSPRVDQQFSGKMESSYLAALFATRRPPDLSIDDQLRITCLRLWVLHKSLQFARSGCRHDKSLLQLCGQIRMACDDKGDRSKLTWLLELSAPRLDLPEFELALSERVEQRVEKDSISSVVIETTRAIKFLLHDEKRPTKSTFMPSCVAQSVTNPANEQEADDLDHFAFPVELDPADDITLHFPASSGEDELTLRQADVSENDTPQEVARVARGIVFQSMEDQQYLRYAWNRLREDEEACLTQAVQAQLEMQTATHQLLGALTALAICCRKSMETVGALPLGLLTSDDWQLNILEGILHRLPARRSVRWQANELAEQWIRPLCDSWQLALQPEIQTVLQHAFELAPDATTVGQLWQNPTQSLESAFNQWCKATPGLKRVLSGMLVRVSEQRAFEVSDDAIFARLITSPARAGIPGAGAYASWSMKKVGSALVEIGAPFVTDLSKADVESNGSGSELDPLDPLLSLALSQAYNSVVELGKVKSAWVDYHNHLVGYAVTVLLAATGARPVGSMFVEFHPELTP